MAAKGSKALRHERLQNVLQSNPFVTDQELSEQLEVSIQTIRLDRIELGIPELRERMKVIAEQSYDPIRSLSIEEVIGDVQELQLDYGGVTTLKIAQEHVFSKTQIARGHVLFAQANSLAVAVINEEIALTTMANIRFIRAVKLGERCVARATVSRHPQEDRNKVLVEVNTYVDDELVFFGQFIVHRSTN